VYHSLATVTNLVGKLSRNANPQVVFKAGRVAHDLLAAMQANGGIVTYADMPNDRRS